MRLTRQRTDEIRTFRETCLQGKKDCVPCIHAIVRMAPAVCPQPFPSPSYVCRSAAVQERGNRVDPSFRQSQPLSHSTTHTSLLALSTGHNCWKPPHLAANDNS